MSPMEATTTMTENEPAPALERPIGAESICTATAVHRPAVAAALVFLALLGSAGGYLGVQVHRGHEHEQRRAMYLEAGRNAATALTTINVQSVDADVQRIRESSTGAFLDDFRTREGAFVEVIKRLGSVSAGTIAQAGIEQEDEHHARVLIAVAVTTTPASADARKLWRMRITLDRVPGGAKFSAVELVP